MLKVVEENYENKKVAEQQELEILRTLYLEEVVGFLVHDQENMVLKLRIIFILLLKASFLIIILIHIACLWCLSLKNNIKCNIYCLNLPHLLV